MSLTRVSGLDHTLLLELCEFLRAQPQHLAVNLGIVLAQQGGHAQFDRRILKLYRTTGHRELAARRMFDVDNHAALAQMRILEDLDAVENLAARHAGVAEYFHHLVLGMRARPGVDDSAERIDVLPAQLVV